MSLAAVTDTCRPCSRGSHDLCTLHDKCGCEECNPSEPPVVVWEEPPAKNRSGAKVMTTEVVAALKANPGRWARLRVYEAKTASSSVPSYERAWPGFEFVGRRVGDGSALYARFVGEVKP